MSDDLDLVAQAIHLGIEVALLERADSQDPPVQADNGLIPGLVKQYLNLRRITGQAHCDLRDDPVRPDLLDVPPDSCYRVTTRRRCRFHRQSDSEFVV